MKETVDRFINKLKITSPNSKISFIEYQSSDLTNYTRTGTYDEIRNVAMANTENADKNLEGYSLKYFRTLQRWTAISRWVLNRMEAHQAGIRVLTVQADI